MSGLELALLIGVLALAVLTLVVLVTTANRLDRLHVRTDAAWAALDAALARRAVVARAVSTQLPAGERLRAAADTAESAPRGERELAENELTRLLAAVDRSAMSDALERELHDAEHRLVIARRMHNDAVRDTRALRGRRKVRYFRLAGSAPAPEYFEIVEPET